MEFAMVQPRRTNSNEYTYVDNLGDLSEFPAKIEDICDINKET